MRRNPWLLAAMFAAVALLGATWVAEASSASSRAASAKSRASVAGKWSGRYSGAFSGTFKLTWKQTRTSLHGSIYLSHPRGTYGINGSVHGKAITFGAVGAGATYTGKVSGKSMSGTYKSPAGGGKWSAHKTS
jgi:hypothetical protein